MRQKLGREKESGLAVGATPEQQPISGEVIVDSPTGDDFGPVFVEERPTAVSVVGWAWIVIGGLALLSSLLNLFLLATDAPQAFGSWLPAALAAQCLLGAVGLYGGIRFLRLDERARKVLEYMTSAFAVLLVASAIGGVVFVAPDLDSSLVLALFAAFMLALYGVPLFFMLKALRSQKVKDAMRPLPNQRH